MNFVSVSLTDAWRKIQDKISQLHAQSLSPVDDIMYDQLSFKPISQTFGELMHQTVRDKGISINRLAELGFSKSKMYRLYEDSQSLMVNDMLDLMRIGGLETGDLDPLLTMLPDKGLDVRYNLYGVQQHMLVETAEELHGRSTSNPATSVIWKGHMDWKPLSVSSMTPHGMHPMTSKCMSKTCRFVASH